MTGQPVQRIGKYEICGTLGKGAMGLVYRAKDAGLQREVALKVITGTDISDEMLERFRIEARAAASLDHPNIVVIYDLGDDAGRPYIAMELLEGEDLREHVRSRGGIAQRDAAELIAQACDGLSYAHRRRIVHRDIKPANIHVCTDGRVKIVDFGVAKMESTALTRTGMVIGTPDYMSPEQIQGKGVDTRSDIFSMGVVLFELLTGKRPFSAESITSVVYNIVFKDPPAFDELDLDVPADLARIVARAMAKDLSARYQDIGEMRDDLRSFLAGRPAATPAASATDATAEMAIEAPSPPPAATSPRSRTVQVAESPAQRRRAAGEPGEPAAAPLAPRRSHAPLVALGVLTLAAAGVGGWLWLDGRGLLPGAGPPPVETPADARAAVAPVMARVPVDVVVAPWARIERLERLDGEAWRSVVVDEEVTPVRLLVPAGRYRMRLSHPGLTAGEELEFEVDADTGAQVRHVLREFNPLTASAGLLGP